MIEAPDIRPPESAVTGEAKGCSLHSLVLQPFYDVGGITIYCGDNRKILPLLDGADLLLTDPPYGIGMAKRGKIGSNNNATVKEYAKSEWDDQTAPAWLVSLAIEKCKTAIIWGGNHYALPPATGWLVWHKKDTDCDFSDCELAWTNTGAGVRYYRYLWNGYWQGNMKEKEVRVHPTQKPQPLMTWCMQRVPEAKTILDPWMGSGTTLVAAKALGLRAIGIEANETYCRAAVARLAQDVLGLENK